jgi:hypothetical protein
MLCSRLPSGARNHEASQRQSRKSQLLPQARGFAKIHQWLRRSGGELDIKVAVFDPVLFVFLKRSRNRVWILYWERNGLNYICARPPAVRYSVALGISLNSFLYSLANLPRWLNPHSVATVDIFVPRPLPNNCFLTSDNRNFFR